MARTAQPCSATPPRQLEDTRHGLCPTEPACPSIPRTRPGTRRAGSSSALERCRYSRALWRSRWPRCRRFAAQAAEKRTTDRQGDAGRAVRAARSNRSSPLVNDEPITGYEIEQRVALAMLGAPDVQRKLQAKLKSPNMNDQFKAFAMKRLQGQPAEVGGRAAGARQAAAGRVRRQPQRRRSRRSTCRRPASRRSMS